MLLACWNVKEYFWPSAKLPDFTCSHRSRFSCSWVPLPPVSNFFWLAFNSWAFSMDLLGKGSWASQEGPCKFWLHLDLICSRYTIFGFGFWFCRNFRYPYRNFRCSTRTSGNTCRKFRNNGSYSTGTSSITNRNFLCAGTSGRAWTVPVFGLFRSFEVQFPIRLFECVRGTILFMSKGLWSVLNLDILYFLEDLVFASLGPQLLRWEPENSTWVAGGVSEVSLLFWSVSTTLI